MSGPYRHGPLIGTLHPVVRPITQGQMMEPLADDLVDGTVIDRVATGPATRSGQ
jgi:hypothetical protein